MSHLFKSKLGVIFCFSLFLSACGGGSEAKKSKPASPKEVKAFYGAALKGDLDTIEDLVEGGLNVNVLNRKRKDHNALHIAAFHGHADVARYLIEQGINMEVYEDGYGRTPLMKATAPEKMEFAQVLLAAGANVNAVEPENAKDTVLMIATQSGNNELVKLLIENGADIHARSSLGFSALDYAKKYREPEVEATLRLHGATE